MMKKLENILPEVKRGVLLKDFTTFKIGGRARYFCAVRTKEELTGALGAAKSLKIPVFILGAGSNLLVSDKGFSGLIVKILNQQPPRAVGDRVIAGAGVTMGELVNVSLKNGLGGTEWMTGIPGTLGGALRGNAGAFGLSMQDIVEGVEALDARSLRFADYDKRKCKFAYRESVLKRKPYFILRAVLRFKKGNSKKLNEISRRIIEMRLKKYKPG
ncbi:MAG: FAD-binding protein, partial [Candidatus Nealsonbacteria bacterium]|nr:FAD-binding protein [Candidatus Nealsonbacteria bacterium]